LKNQIYREVGVEKMASEIVEEQTEKYLKYFADFIEPNPRAMKRLVNAYTIIWAIATLLGMRLDIKGRKEQLVLWAIISLRWPLLEAGFSKYPGLFAYVSRKNEDDTSTCPVFADEDKEIRELANDKRIREFFNQEVQIENGDPVKLDQAAIDEFSKLHDTAGSMA